MHYKSMQEVESLVTAFEEQTTALEAWTHEAHLAVCCWYVMFSAENAEGQMRSGIRALNRSLGIMSTPTSGYHETLTLFWIAKVRSLVEVCAGPELAVLNAVVGGLADQDLVYFHYSREQIASADARLAWREPDLHRLPAEGIDAWEWPQRSVG